MPGEQQRHHLVAQLLRRTAASRPRRSASSSSDRMSTPRSPARPPPVDLGEDHPVEPRPCAVHRPPRRCPGRAASAPRSPCPSSPAPARTPRPSRRRARGPGRSRTAPASRRAAPAGASRRRGRAACPARQASSARSASSTMIAVRRGELLAVEGRQHDPARAPVVVAVDREQAVAEQRDQVAHRAVAPAEVRRVRHGHVVVRLRAEREHHRRYSSRIENTGPYRSYSRSSSGSGSRSNSRVRRRLKDSSPGGNWPRAARCQRMSERNALDHTAGNGWGRGHAHHGASYG